TDTSYSSGTVTHLITVATHVTSEHIRANDVYPDDKRSLHRAYGRWRAPPDTARDAPVARASVFGRPRSRYAPRIANAIASRYAAGTPYASVVSILPMSGASASRRRSMSAGFRAPPPATRTRVIADTVSRRRPPAIVCAVSSVAVASASSLVPPRRATSSAIRRTNAAPNSSRPVLFG